MLWNAPCCSSPDIEVLVDLPTSSGGYGAVAIPASTAGGFAGEVSLFDNAGAGIVLGYASGGCSGFGDYVISNGGTGWYADIEANGPLSTGLQRGSYSTAMFDSAGTGVYFGSNFQSVTIRSERTLYQNGYSTSCENGSQTVTAGKVQHAPLPWVAPFTM